MSIYQWEEIFLHMVTETIRDINSPYIAISTEIFDMFRFHSKIPDFNQSTLGKFSMRVLFIAGKQVEILPIEAPFIFC